MLHQTLQIAGCCDSETDASEVRFAVTKHCQSGALPGGKIFQKIEHSVLGGTVQTADQVVRDKSIAVPLRRARGRADTIIIIRVRLA